MKILFKGQVVPRWLEKAEDKSMQQFFTVSALVLVVTIKGDDYMIKPLFPSKYLFYFRSKYSTAKNFNIQGQSPNGRGFVDLITKSYWEDFINWAKARIR